MVRLGQLVRATLCDPRRQTGAVYRLRESRARARGFGIDREPFSVQDHNDSACIRIDGSARQLPNFIDWIDEATSLWTLSYFPRHPRDDPFFGGASHNLAILTLPGLEITGRCEYSEWMRRGSVVRRENEGNCAALLQNS